MVESLLNEDLVSLIQLPRGKRAPASYRGAADLEEVVLENDGPVFLKAVFTLRGPQERKTGGFERLKVVAESGTGDVKSIFFS